MISTIKIVTANNEHDQIDKILGSICFSSKVMKFVAFLKIEYYFNYNRVMFVIGPYV